MPTQRVLLSGLSGRLVPENGEQGVLLMNVASIRQINPVVRAVAVIGAVMALVTGATFAALTDSVTLSNNTIGTTSANADLLIWDSGDNEFQSEAPGFNFTGLEPGQESEDFHFYFKNNGDVPLDVTAEVPVDPTFSTGLTAADVSLTFKGACDTNSDVTYTLAQLETGPVNLPCNPLEESAQGVVGEDDTNEANYRVSVTINDSVVIGSDPLTVSGFDIVFDGTAATTL